MRESPAHGKGVFAIAPLARGELIITFGGIRAPRHATDFSTYHLQVGDAEYLGPSGDLDDYMNHSCTPNAAFAGSLDLLALRDIALGEEITWDYGTSIDEADFNGFACSCGAMACRGRVLSFGDLSAAEQQRLRPGLLPYLSEKYFLR